jgi:hypothetical protein
MIKISTENQETILEEFYKILTEQNGKKWNVPYRLNRLINKYNKNKRLREMYTYLRGKVLKDQGDNSILTAKPDELFAFSQAFEVKYATELTPRQRQALKNVFYYDSYDNWKAYAIAKKINLKVCPYCNRAYTFVIGTDAEKSTRFEFDHFFPKSRYPYLSLSFFNLIPSCHTCNATLKKDALFTLDDNIHPYVEGFSNHVIFTITPKNIGFVNGKADSYSVQFTKNPSSNWLPSKFQAAFNNISILKLEKLYNMHLDYTDELIQKSIVYNKEYIDSLFLAFGGTLFRNVEDVKRMVLGNYTLEEDYGKRPL